MRFILKEGQREANVLYKHAAGVLSRKLKKPENIGDQEYYNILVSLVNGTFDRKLDNTQKLIPRQEGENDNSYRLRVLGIAQKYSDLDIRRLQTIHTWPDGPFWPSKDIRGRNKYILWLAKQAADAPLYPEYSYPVKKFFEYTTTQQAKQKGIQFDFSKSFNEMRKIAAEHISNVDHDKYRTNDYEELSDGFRIYKISISLQSKEDVFHDAQIEGCKVGHCLGYKKLSSLEHGYDFYSLRDSNDEPHLTLFVNTKTNEIEEAVGKSDSAHPKYLKILAPWLKKHFSMQQVLRGRTDDAVYVNAIKAIYANTIKEARYHFTLKNR